MEKIERLNTKWFILAHCFNMDGRAASQTITDRIPFLMKKGIDPLVLSAPTGIKDHPFPSFPNNIPRSIRYPFRNEVYYKKQIQRPNHSQYTKICVSGFMCAVLLG